MTSARKLTPAGRGEGRWWPLVTGALEQGAYALPAGVLLAVETRQKLWDHKVPAAAQPAPLAEQIYQAARHNEAIPGSSPESLDIVARDAARLVAHQHVMTAAVEARERAGHVVRGAIVNEADEMLELLRDAHTEVVGEATGLCERIGMFGLTDIWPATAPPKVMEARGRLKPLSVRYACVAQARRILGDAEFLGRPQLDIDNEYLEMANRATVCPPSWPRKPAPWDMDPDTEESRLPDARLFTMIITGCKLWMPSPAEMDKAYATDKPKSGRVVAARHNAHNPQDPIGVPAITGAGVN